MLYILECIIRALGTMTGGSDKPLYTTGESMTYRDGAVGIAGVFVGVVIIFVISFLIRHFKTKVNKQKSSDSDVKNVQQDNNNIAINSQKPSKLFYILDCMALGVFVLHSGRNKPMMSTNKKPTRKDAITSVVCWTVISILIVMVVLISNLPK